jgi:hypothetical protein
VASVPCRLVPERDTLPAFGARPPMVDRPLGDLCSHSARTALDAWFRVPIRSGRFRGRSFRAAWEPVWVPAEWPDGFDRQECFILVPPPGESGPNEIYWESLYEVRFTNGDEPLRVLGCRRPPVRSLAGGLFRLEGERFETWTRPAGRRPLVVVCVPVWDVHVSGSASYETTLSIARSLVQVAPASS